MGGGRRARTRVSRPNAALATPQTAPSPLTWARAARTTSSTESGPARAARGRAGARRAARGASYEE